VSGVAERRNELLADRALDGLSDAEAQELEALGGADDDSFDLAAGALALAELERGGAAARLPAALAARVLGGSTKRTADGAAGSATAGPSIPGRSAPLRARERDAPRRERAVGPRWRLPNPGWLVAAAAMVLAVFGWLRPREAVERVQVVQAPVPRAPTPAEARDALLARATDARTIPWSAAPDPSARGATGDVVWSPSLRQGYMRIRGLAANDPRALQYQLWIFDGTRDQRFPVDGGVFDVAGGEVIVPIRATIDVRDAKLFAVTVEKPGGVVVSKRERIVLTAAL